MKNDKSQSSFVNIGSSFLLVIFLILAFVTFAILSLSSAKRDYTMSQRLAAHKSAYYAASGVAEMILSRIDEELETQAKLFGENIRDYKSAVTKALDGKAIEGAVLFCEESEDKMFLSYQVPLSEGQFAEGQFAEGQFAEGQFAEGQFASEQALYVKLLVTDYNKSATYYEIEAWQLISTGTWEGDQSIQLIPMGE